MNKHLGTTPLHDDAPEDWERILKRAAIVQHLRALDASGASASPGATPLRNPTLEDRA